MLHGIKRRRYVDAKIVKIKTGIGIDRQRDLKAEMLARKLGNCTVFYFKPTQLF